MVVSVTPEGQTNAALFVERSAPADPTDRPELMLIVVPFDVLPEQRIVSANDVRVARLANAAGVTIFAVLAPPAQSRIPIEVRNCCRLAETSEGKAKVDLDFTYPYLNQADRPLLTSPNVVAAWDVRVQLPRQFSAEELSYFPTLMRLDQGRTFAFVSNPVAPVAAWIVFPNPASQKLSVAKLIASLLFGFLTLILQVPVLKARRVGSLVAIFVVSLALLAVSVYYSLALAKRRDFIEWSAALVPHAVFALCAAVYVLVAQKRQATITGVVLIDGQPARFADVRLFQLLNGTKVEIRHADTLVDGQYLFHVWCRGKPIRLSVAAVAKNTDSVSSALQDVSPAERVDVETLSLKRTSVVPAQQAGSIATSGADTGGG